LKTTRNEQNVIISDIFCMCGRTFYNDTADVL
jgi:hypothetical protein